SAAAGDAGDGGGESLGLSLNFPTSGIGAAGAATLGVAVGPTAGTGTVGAAALGGSAEFEAKSAGGWTGAEGVANGAGDGAVTRGFAMASGCVKPGRVCAADDEGLGAADNVDGAVACGETASSLGLKR